MTRLHSDATTGALDTSALAYTGIFFAAFATLMYQILLTRIFSVTLLHHFAFVARSLAMFYLMAGALIVSMAPRSFATGRLRRRPLEGRRREAARL
jgi:hypothetical protein